jgi:hypothetical protein
MPNSVRSIASDRPRRTRVIFAAWFVFIAWASWEMSPFNGGAAVGFFLLGAYFTYLLKPRRLKVAWAIALYLFTVVDILGIATWHDLTVKSYASAQCCDGSYSYSAHRQGTCSWHHGVCAWNPEIPPWWRTIRP